MGEAKLPLTKNFVTDYNEKFQISYNDLKICVHRLSYKSGVKMAFTPSYIRLYEKGELREEDSDS